MTTRSILVFALVACTTTISALAQPARPQTPGDDVAYRVDADVIINVDDAHEPSHRLAGTLTLPDPEAHGDGPYPGVVLVTGSGPQDRDSTLFGHKPFAVLADALTNAGVAVLRCDDRGVGDSTGQFSTTTTLGFAADARAAMAWLAAHESVDPGRVGILGHSEGGIVAQIIAGTPEDDRDGAPAPAFAVLLAAPAMPGRDVMVLQARLLAMAAGVSEDDYAPQEAAQVAFFDAIDGKAPPEELERTMRALVDIQLSQQQINASEEQIANLVKQSMAGYTGDWMRTFLTLDPAEHLARAECPVLAVNGTLDLQVDADQNLAVIERVLRERAARAKENSEHAANYTIVRAGGLNHLLQPARVGSVQEYMMIPTTFDPPTLAMVTAWIVETAE